ncbi:Kinesin-like protein [Parasponia andersonii]|uniref:Kinesin-like protein n=1 Tax=Parasponia andersonii TaxID=3476 RepID=A0A2P5CUU7_PARAD|nr:Kinesin-like protein [Parasponia andersonii]
MMSKESSNLRLRFSGRNVSTWEAKENESEEEPLNPNPILYPPLRTPLNTVADPAQFHSHSRRHSFSDRKLEDYANCIAIATPPRASAARGPKTQTTPSASASRNGSKITHSVSTQSSSSSSSSSSAEIEFELPHFELQQDSSFWADHNVQVLIRIRPLSSMERVSQGQGQGHARCLRQESPHSLIWLGHPETRFTFDHVASHSISQENLFRVAGLPMVENCLSGYNSCMFAYGQTGSGKTYTMMGEINEIEGKLNQHCGLTPRIFEYLFKRIFTEEQTRRDQQLKYTCKCSFLEIYNEQITDLLEPSSTNLQLREDLKKGVYVENLTEYNAKNVNDVVKLLLQGAANRKVAATHMNSESSRSHTVFTCTIESRWGKDSMTHFRFARLNLVDLAGSERQKSSGAEGDRLKEAANINKSLSTLGLVIMSLVDLAHGKHRHVPYRDSRLTFLLQDSLGGNSKTTIIANVSPSICSANETLSTLKFAQRAKLIQNNAKVNEDASGDINALQRQIEQLKGQLSFLMKHSYIPRSLPSCVPSSQESRCDLTEEHNFLGDAAEIENQMIVPVESNIKCLEASLFGALRREKLSETAMQKLEDELEQMRSLAQEREEDAQRSKMMLRFREEEIKRLELLTNGMLSAENYLVQENKVLIEEIQLLRAGMDRNSELTQYAVENNRLREQLQKFQNFYEHGERETLLAEVSKLRNQDKDTTKELEDCRIMNSKLIREVKELRTELRKNLNCNQAASDSVRIICKPLKKTNDEALQNHMDNDVDDVPIMFSNVIEKELMNATTTESDQVCLIIEQQYPHDESCRYMESVSKNDKIEGQFVLTLKNEFSGLGYLDSTNNGLVAESKKETERMAFQAKLDRMTKDLEEVRLLNSHFQEEQALQFSCQQKAELVREQVEMETARTILQLQEEVDAVQCKLDEKLYFLTEENTKLRNIVASKEEEVKALNTEWEKATLELTGFLVDGARSLKNVSNHIESIACSFPPANVWISEHVQRAAKIYIEKEETILQLRKSLENAQNTLIDMAQKLSSLKGVTMALTELPHLDNDEISKEHVGMLLNDKINMIRLLEKKLNVKEAQVTEAEKFATVAFIVINWLFENHKVTHKNEKYCIDPPAKMANLEITKAFAVEDVMAQVEVMKLEVLESENSMVELKDKCKNFELCTIDTPSVEAYKYQKFENQFQMLHQIRDELTKTNFRLKVIEDFVHTEVNVFECSATNVNLVHADVWSPDCSLSSSDFSIGSVVSKDSLDASSSVCLPKSTKKMTEQIVLTTEGPTHPSGHQLSENSNVPLKDLFFNQATEFYLKRELKVLIDAFDLLRIRLVTLSNGLDFGDCSDPEDLKQLSPSFQSTLEKTNVDSDNTKKIEDDEKIDNARRFLTKFEEAHATIKEADFMLNALVKANESAKQLTGVWKHTGEELMIERANLIKEVEHLKSTIRVKENENILLHDQAHCSLVEIASSMSSLQEFCIQLKNDEEKITATYSDVFSIGMEMLHFIRNSRSFLEEICFEIMEKDFAMLVLYQCYLGGLINQIMSLDVETDVNPFRHQEINALVSNLQSMCSNVGNKVMVISNKPIGEGVQREVNNNMEGSDMCLSNDDLINENLALKKELKRKEVLLEGLLFDFSLLQESASNKKDIKEETEKIVFSLSQVRHELETKTRQLEEMLVHHKKLECRLVETEEALDISNSNLSHASETIEIFSEQNAELKVLLKDLYLKKSEVEEQLEEQKELVNSLEEELLLLTSSIEKEFEDNLKRVTSEKDQLQDEVLSLNDKVEMAYALVDEKEAIIVEARQVSEANKIYAEQKEEEVKILERSIEELESTIDVLEKKVFEMDDKVERHRLIRDSLELELKALKQRLLTIENLTENVDSNTTNVEQTENQISRQLQNKSMELRQAQTRIKLLEEERAEQDKEIKQYKEYITELMLHADTQASQYQQKYKTLEAMVREVKRDSISLTHSTSTAPTLYKAEKTPARTWGSSSPFRCIASLVQQMNLERDQELSTSRLHIEELEALAATRQKEVCMLNTRLAAAESMTHDVIRDLLGVKLDMSNFANLIDQYQIKKLVEDANQQTEDFLKKEEELDRLRKQINDLNEERESCILEINKREGDLLAAHITVEQLQERDSLLSAQNEMLKRDKTNLKEKVAKLDDMVKALLGSKFTQEPTQPKSLPKKKLKSGDADFTKRLEQSEKLLSRVNGELAQYYKSSRDKNIDGIGTSYRNSGFA